MEIVRQVLQGLNTYFDFANPFIYRVLYLNHAFIVANILRRFFDNKTIFPDNKKEGYPLFAGCMLMIASGLGGAIVVGILLGETHSYLTQDFLLLYLFCAWILTIYFPFNLVYYLTGNFFTFIIQAVFVANTIFANVERGVKLFPEHIVAPLILGTLGGIASGGITKPFFFNLYLQKAVFPSELSNPTKSTKFSFATALCYFLGVTNKLMPDITIPVGNETIVLTVQNLFRFVWIFFYIYFVWLARVQSVLPTSQPVKIPTVEEAKKKKDDDYDVTETQGNPATVEPEEPKTPSKSQQNLNKRNNTKKK